MKRILFILMVVLIPFSCLAQEDETEKDHYFTYEPTFSVANKAEIGLSVGYKKVGFSGSRFFNIANRWHGPYLGLSYGANNGEGLMISKLGYSVMHKIIIVRSALINYTDFGQGMFVFRPEAGLSFFEVLSVTYGYNIPLTNTDYFNKKGHVLTINISLALGFIIND
ncbi:MAG: hypothetical protein JKY54_09875 [Flavobacteriales bacterium]|nr:hypothetical protein [Flavobacteriales bacterium]